jgi:hypothetical protein
MGVRLSWPNLPTSMHAWHGAWQKKEKAKDKKLTCSVCSWGAPLSLRVLHRCGNDLQRIEDRCHALEHEVLATVASQRTPQGVHAAALQAALLAVLRGTAEQKFVCKKLKTLIIYLQVSQGMSITTYARKAVV